MTIAGVCQHVLVFFFSYINTVQFPTRFSCPKMCHCFHSHVPVRGGLWGVGTIGYILDLYGSLHGEVAPLVFYPKF
jgi:hypothetical protein